MPRIMLLMAASLVAGCGSSESDVLTDADIHQASAPDNVIDRLDPELESDAPPPSPEVSVAPLEMPFSTDRPDFDLPVTEEDKPKAQAKAKARRGLDSEAADLAPISMLPAEEPFEPVAAPQAPSQPSVPIQSDDGS